MWTDTEAVRQSSSRSKVVAEVKNILEMRLYIAGIDWASQESSETWSRKEGSVYVREDRTYKSMREYLGLSCSGFVISKLY